MVLLPASFSYYSSSHYFAYVGTVFVVTFLYYILERLRKSNLFFMLATLLAIGLLYYFDFPIGLAILFPIGFLWRYLNIRHYERDIEDMEPLIHRETINKANLYIKIALFAAAIVIVYAEEFYVLWYVLILLIVLYAGYLLSHISSIRKQEREGANLKVFSLIPLVFSVGAGLASVIFIPFRDVFKKFWVFLANAIIYLASLVVGLIDLVIPNRMKSRGLENNGTESGGESWDGKTGYFEYSPGIDEGTLTIFLGIISFLILAIIIYRRFKKTQEDLVGRVEAETEYTTIDMKEDEDKGFFKNLFSRRKRLNRHPVRQLIYNFEKNTKKHDLGRYVYESLTEWFDRLQIDLNVSSYEKVRYGKLDISAEEVKQLENQLKEINIKKIISGQDKEEEVGN